MACSGCYTKVKKRYKYCISKALQTDWQRFSDAPMNTYCSAHSQEIFIRTQNIHSIKNFFFFSKKTKNISTRGKKNFTSRQHFVFCFFFVLFFVSFSRSLGDRKPLRFSLFVSYSPVTPLRQFPWQLDQGWCSLSVPPMDLHLLHPAATAPGGCNCEESYYSYLPEVKQMSAFTVLLLC